MKIRFTFIVIIFGLAYGLLIFKLYNLQIEQGANFFQQAEARENYLQNNIFKRGAIYVTDRNQKLIPVAVNKEFPVIFAVPKEISQPEETAEILAPIIGWEKEKLNTSLSKPNDLFEQLLEKPSAEQIQSVKSLNLKGIYFDFQNFRNYPFRNLASQVIGFVGVNKDNDKLTGLYGLEKFYNDKLGANNDLTLTLDLNLQTRAEEILDNLIKKFEAAGGTVIIQKPATGEILALTNKPDFNPNSYGQAEISAFLNLAVQGLYEPGSVLKIITMAAGLDSGKVTPETTFFDTGSVTLNGKTIENWDKKAYGQVTMTNVIERSINTGAVWLEKTIGHDLFYNYLMKFGLGGKTGIDLPLEGAGNLINLENKEARDIDFATASFGQGVAVTPLELISAFSVIANNGNLMRPYLNVELKPKILRQVITPETSQKLKEMLVSAVEKAQVAAIANYRIAGKTGTAQVPDFEKSGYTSEAIHTYVGFAPAYADSASVAAFTILIKLDKPRGAPLAGSTVVPAFKELAQFVLNYYNIPPDKLQ